jgi:hypothetical protein
MILSLRKKKNYSMGFFSAYSFWTTVLTWKAQYECRAISVLVNGEAYWNSMKNVLFDISSLNSIFFLSFISLMPLSLSLFSLTFFSYLFHYSITIKIVICATQYGTSVFLACVNRTKYASKSRKRETDFILFLFCIFNSSTHLWPTPPNLCQQSSLLWSMIHSVATLTTCWLDQPLALLFKSWLYLLY